MKKTMLMFTLLTCAATVMAQPRTNNDGTVTIQERLSKERAGRCAVCWP